MSGADCLYLSVRNFPAVTGQRQGILTFDSWASCGKTVKQLECIIAPTSPTEWSLDLTGKPFGRRIEASLYIQVRPRCSKATGRVLGQTWRFACPCMKNHQMCDRDVDTLKLYRGENQFGCDRCQPFQRSEGSFSYYAQWPEIDFDSRSSICSNLVAHHPSGMVLSAGYGVAPQCGTELQTDSNFTFQTKGRATL